MQHNMLVPKHQNKLVMPYLGWEFSMPAPHEKLAESLDALKELQQGNRRVFRSDDLSRVHRERLVENGFLQEVMKGWLISSSPDTQAGESTPWHASFWEFCRSRWDEHTCELQYPMYLVCCLLLTRRPATSTLVPYTTLFRSGTAARQPACVPFRRPEPSSSRAPGGERLLAGSHEGLADFFQPRHAGRREHPLACVVLGILQF